MLKRLEEILKGSGVQFQIADIYAKSSIDEIEVSAVEYDSRMVKENGLFVAVKGFVTDGHTHVADAARRGAVAALVEEPTGTAGITEVVVADTRAAMGPVAHEFYGSPSEHLKVHTITGTNGKTTTLHLIDSILQENGIKTGVVGTLGYRAAGTSAIAERTSAERTSPEAVDLARLLALMLDGGVEAVTMEVSSHALSLGRVLGMKMDTATFTNLSRDHLDFHGSMAEYGAAKRKLFDLIAGDAGKPGASAIVNRDDAFGRELLESLSAAERIAVLSYGMTDGDVYASNVEMDPEGTTAIFHTPAGEIDVHLNLIAGFNVMNALAATAVAVTQSVPLESIRAGLGKVERVAGRLELVHGARGFSVLVDYAHTPDALEKVLTSVRDLNPTRVITVFGCGGDRDRGKRPMMGRIAARMSDLVVITSDNPRTEEPGAIIAEILEGVRDVETSSGGSGRVTRHAGVDVIEDRRKAITAAVAAAAAGDIVVIAGKGHEDYQIIGNERLHFDDREEARAAIAARQPEAH